MKRDLALTTFPVLMCDGCSIYIYIYMCVCVCVRVCKLQLLKIMRPQSPRAENGRDIDFREFVELCDMRSDCSAL